MTGRALSETELAIGNAAAARYSREGFKTIIRGLESLLERLPPEAGWQVRFELKCALRDARNALAELEAVSPADGHWRN